MECFMIQTELPKSYTPAEVEGDIRRRWDESGAFHAEPDAPGTPFSIIIPPPNVTAALHLGHAFNNTLQDVLVRYHRMRGCNTLWMPGTDHAGIATQTVVEKRLMQSEGKKRTDYSRDDFIARVQAWKDEYEATIIEQLKAMGASCDFERTRFTMDEMCAKAVREAFFQLFKDGLIYRGKRLVNWDPVTQTALADDEVEMQEVAGKFYYLRYPVVDGESGAKAQGLPSLGYVTVATTRPETMLGDTAIALNPRDPRAPELRGKFVRLPIVNRIIPIIEDDYVIMPGTDDPKAAFATGFLKVTPAHDPNDWDIGLRHNLSVINVMAPDASISDAHGWEDVSDEARPLVGLAREDARKKIVEWFKANNLYEGDRDYTHSVGHSYRSHVPIEPYLSDQWYVRVTDDRLKGAALRAMAPEQLAPGLPGTDDPAKAGAKLSGAEGDGELRFFPDRYAKTFQQWHENLRDWCISRQLWWGHRIPVWRLTVDFPGLPDEENPHWSEFKEQFGAFAKAAGVMNDITIRVDKDADIFVCTRTERADKAMSELMEFIATQDMVEVTQQSDTPLRFQFSSEFVAAKEIAQQLEIHKIHGQDPDVLDTWFSSALWPLSTMGWPEPDASSETKGLLDTFNPTSVLCTAREIITLWVSRMVMFNRYFNDGKVPFRHVYIHAMIQDGHGQKMSKSLGNGVDPRDIISTHGTDALRFTLTQIATATQDVRLPVDLVCPHTGETFTPKTITTPAGHVVPAPIQSCPSDPNKKMVTAYGVASGQAEPTKDMPLAINASAKFDLGRNFANKLWNAVRFALSNLDQAGNDDSRKAASGRLVDRWMLSRLQETLSKVEQAIANYQFNAYAEAMYDLVWREFCDWYLEVIKPTVKDDAAQQRVLASVLNAMLRMLHPIMPFVTETLWQHVSAASEHRELACIELPPCELAATAAWPTMDASIHDADAVRTFERLQQLIESIRTIRGERNIPRKKKLTLHVPLKVKSLVQEADGLVETMALLEQIVVMEDRPGAGAVPLAFEGAELYLTGLMDVGDAQSLEAERTRLTKFIEEKERAINGFRQKLNNEKYVSKAPPQLVEETRAKLAEAEADWEAARNALESLGSG